MEGMLSTYEQYAGDRMVSDDCLLLIKSYVNTKSFETHFVPVAAQVINSVADCVSNPQDKKKQEILQNLIDNNKIK